MDDNPNIELDEIAEGEVNPFQSLADFMKEADDFSCTTIDIIRLGKLQPDAMRTIFNEIILMKISFLMDLIGDGI